jgi:heme/copper-type cytochrome/quinol oxidase subunit 2
MDFEHDDQPIHQPGSTSTDRRETSERRPWTTFVAWGLWAITFVIIIATAIFTFYLRKYHLDASFTAGYTDVAGNIALLIFPTIGALIVSRRPNNVIGWLFVVSGVLWGIYVLADIYTVYGTMAEPGSLPAIQFSAWMTTWPGTANLLAIVTLLPLLFPNGRALSPRWRPVVWLNIAALAGLMIVSAVEPGQVDDYPGTVNPLGIESFSRFIHIVLETCIWVLLVLIVVAAVSCIIRFRRSTGEERQQLEWFTYAAAMAVFGFIAVIILSNFGVADIWLGIVGFTAVMGIPVATGIAILKYRLYAIDLIINRTLVYSVLTALLALVYAGSVILLQQVLSPFVNGSNGAIAGSTLLVAALFQPARTRVQGSVDRRFYRRKYDASRTIDEFSARLRQEIDLDTLTAELCNVVHQTMQPEHVWLWLRPTALTSASDSATGEPVG